MSTRESAKPSVAKTAVAEKLAPGQRIDLALLRVDDTMGLCRYAGTRKKIKLRAKNVWLHEPGEILTVEVRSLGPTTLSGVLVDSRIEASKLGLKALALEQFEDWNPGEEFWGEGESPPDWALPIIQHGPRPQYEMEQVIPGIDWEDPDSDPIGQAIDAHNTGHTAWAYDKLYKLLARDLRCLDAHAHLGNFRFANFTKEALRHYEIGVAIGQLSLPQGRDFLIPWGCIDNRPYLRCLFGKALCLWRLDDRKGAAALFEDLLWLNPSDNQGARFNLARCLRGDDWTDE